MINILCKVFLLIKNENTYCDLSEKLDFEEL